MVRAQVRDEHVGHAQVGGQFGEQRCDRLQATRRCTDADDRELVRRSGPFRIKVREQAQHLFALVGGRVAMPVLGRLQPAALRPFPHLVRLHLHQLGGLRQRQFRRQLFGMRGLGH